MRALPSPDSGTTAERTNRPTSAGDSEPMAAARPAGPGASYRDISGVGTGYLFRSHPLHQDRAGGPRQDGGAPDHRLRRCGEDHSEVEGGKTE
jgi:hypothetical protein